MEMAKVGMVFNKEKFNKNAVMYVKKLMSKDVDFVDKKVVCEEGQINYEVDGQQRYLYPVDILWCDNNDN